MDRTHRPYHPDCSRLHSAGRAGERLLRGVSPRGTGVVVLHRWASCKLYDGIDSYAIRRARSAVQTVAEGPQRVEQIGDERFLVAVGEFLTHRYEHRQRV